MARKWVVVVGVLALVGLLTACAGPQGEQGPVGPAGPAGPEGPAGPAGESVPTSEVVDVTSEYVGDQLCSGCHNELAQIYMQSGHPWSLSSVVDGPTPDYPFTEVSALPRGYTHGEISYIIGGYNWKALFVDSEGYIITDAPGSSDNTSYLNQFNIGNTSLGLISGWSSYHAGAADLAFTCGECHATGYNNSGSQDDLPGIVGTWAQPGVRCEACHGPGSLHAANPGEVRMTIERDSAQCQECHTYKDIQPAELDIRNGFIQHADQYGDLSQSKHQILDCLTCHDPHSGVVQLRLEGQQTTQLACADCHFQEARYQNNPSHVALNINCIDCHMPRPIQNGSANPLGMKGDFRTHVVAIDPQTVSQFDEDGSLASGQTGLDFACRQCHGSTRTDAELQSAAIGYHAVPESQLTP
jgi:predicted CXXCH cytochrome family protein